MKTRIIITCIILILMMTGSGARLFYLVTTEEYQKAAAVRNTTTLTLSSGRGLIYDRNGERLVEADSRWIASVSPSEENTNTLCRLLPEQAVQIKANASTGKPYLITLNEPVTVQGVSVLQVTNRYDPSPLAPHIIGYTNGSGKGVTGIEASYDELLSDARKQTVTYINDAYGRLITGAEPEIHDNTDSSVGVRLTLDKQVQQAVADAAKQKNLTSGAVVVLSIPDNQILASTSLPDFDPNDVAASLQKKGSPLLNKAFCAYSTGSVFKLLVAAAALDSGIPADFTVECKGEITVGDVVFHCHHQTGHGELDMSGGIAQSCNIYFIELAKRVGGSKLLEYAQRMGFGNCELLASTISTQKGILPSLSTLKLPAGLANFAFGQGDLTATPLQIACLVSCIAGGGQLYEPTLVLGTVDEKGNLNAANQSEPVRVMKESTADIVNLSMQQTMLTGTGKSVMPKTGGAGGKTATAETGILVEGREINRAWFAGFYPAENPRYAIVVMSEDGVSGSESAGPVFQAICDKLAGLG